jgi:RNA polymerase sigma factor for flagellar operon FliA
MAPSEQERFRWESYWAAGNPEGESRAEVIRAYLPMVRAIAGRLKAGLPAHVPYDDLVSSGVVGLIAAVDRFDPARGYNFPRYAAIRARGAMLDELRAMDWAPRSVRQDEAEVEEARKSLEASSGRQATGEEIAGRLGLDREKYARLMKRLAPRNPLQLEETGPQSEDRPSMLSVLKDASSPDPFEQAESRDAARAIQAAVALLKDRLRQVITLYYFDDLSVKEIARIFQVTQGRISQMHTEALGTLRKRLQDLA